MIKAKRRPSGKLGFIDKIDDISEATTQLRSKATRKRPGTFVVMAGTLKIEPNMNASAMIRFLAQASLFIFKNLTNHEPVNFLTEYINIGIADA
jgi:hypothetical protein